MKRLTTLLVFLLGCEIAEAPAPRCVGDAGTAPATAAQVCARLTALGCPVTKDPGACPAAYAAAQATTEPSDFARLTTCYLAASDCAALSACQQACGPMDRAIRTRDASVDSAADAAADVIADAASQDAPADAASQDAPVDAAPQDAPADAAPQDAPADAAPQDAPADAAPQDAPADAAPQDVVGADAPADAPTGLDAPAGDAGSPDA